MKTTVSFNVTKAESELIEKIAARAVRVARADGVHYPRLDAAMDVTATHANGCALRLAALLAADDFNFAHDIYGIRNCLDRKTGQLTRCFSPRFSDSSWLVEQEAKVCGDCQKVREGGDALDMCGEHYRRLRVATRSENKADRSRRAERRAERSERAFRA